MIKYVLNPHFIITVNMKIKNLNKFKIIAVLGIAFLATLASIGCNTMHGIGTDIEKTGEKIQKESE